MWVNDSGFLCLFVSVYFFFAYLSGTMPWCGGAFCFSVAIPALTLLFFSGGKEADWLVV
jgi:hypothetical protein